MYIHHRRKSTGCDVMEQNKICNTFSDRRGLGADKTDDADQKNQNDLMKEGQKDSCPNPSSYINTYNSAVQSNTTVTCPMDYYRLLGFNTSEVANNDLIILHDNFTNDRQPGFGACVHHDQGLTQNRPNFCVLVSYPLAAPLIGGWLNANNPFCCLPTSNNQKMAPFLITPAIRSMDNTCRLEQTSKELIQRIGPSLFLSPDHVYVSSVNNYPASSPLQQPYLLHTAALPHIISKSLLQSLSTHDLMYNMGACTTPVLQQQLNEEKNSITAESENDACEPNSLTHHLLYQSTQKNAGCSVSEHITKPSSNKRKRKEKDAPRRPLSAYNLFFKDRRADILKTGLQETKHKAHDTEKPSAKIIISSKGVVAKLSASTPRVRKGRNPPHHIISFKEMAQKVSEQWKNVSEEEKQQYQIQAKEEKERYQDDLYLYQKKKQSKNS